MTVATQNNQSTPTKLRPDWVIIGFMVVVHAIALLGFLPANFSWGAVGVAVFLHWVTGGLGITLGFHRLVTHRSFQVPKWLEYFFVLCGTLAMQGSPIEWIGMHRMHHVYSDTTPDPHDSNRGFWWSHMGWMLFDVPMQSEVPRYTKDIKDDPVYKFLDKYLLLPQIILGIILYLIGGWSFVIWGIFVRMVTVFHCTWLVNSATHMWGYQSHESDDKSRNCWWVALLTYGEGWHNNHHAYQYSARHGLQWWEVDLTWMTIRFLQMLGLATKVKLADSKAEA